MTDAIDNCYITDPQDLKYISDVVERVLDNWHNLADIKDLQKTLNEISLERARQLQMNLVFEENRLIGFNFSFTSDPSRTTYTIPLKQQEMNINLGNSPIIPYQKPTTAIDRTAIKTESNIASYSPSPKEIVLTPGLPVESQQIINPDNVETQESLISASKFGKINPGLTNAANQLVNQHEVNGLLLTGLILKTGISVANTLQMEEKPDIQTSGLAIIKRFQQVLSQEFIALKSGDSPSAFNWKDPESDQQYHFCFEAAQISVEGDILTPASLRGFEYVSGSNSMQPVFNATLIDAKYNRWSIEQCDFNSNQIQSLNLATKATSKNIALDDFSSEI
jgi:hypothetical protein